MNFKKVILTNNDCYKAQQYIVPKGVMIHSTGVNNPSLSRYVPGDEEIGVNRYNNHWDMPGVGACVHAFIGKMANGAIATVQTLPWNMRGWHCGRSGNNTHISFEICEDNLSDLNYFNSVYREAVELTAMLCKTYGLNPKEDGVVICHSEGNKLGIASAHADVMHWFPKFGKTMDIFREDVFIEMEGEEMSKEQIKEIVYEVLAEIEKEKASLEVSSWAKDIISEAKTSGITDGSRPRSNTTREETVAMILAAFKNK